MKIRVTVCDVCQDRELVAETYRVQGIGRTGSADLCDEHASPLLALLREAKPKQTRRRRTTSKVVTLDEIEAQKTSKK